MPNAADNALRHDTEGPQAPLDQGPNAADGMTTRPHRFGAPWPLVTVAAIAFLWILQALSGAAIAILLGLILACAIRPFVDALTDWGLHRSIAVSAVLLVGMGGATLSFLALQEDMARTINSLPATVGKLRVEYERQLRDRSGVMNAVASALREIDRLVSSAPTTASAPLRPSPEPNSASQWLRDQFLLGSANAFSVFTQGVLVIMLTSALVAGGRDGRRQFVSALSVQLSQRKRWVRILDDVQQQLQTYMVTNLAVNIALGIGTWLGLFAIGAPHALFWGVAAGVLHFVPFMGPLIVVVGSTLSTLSEGYGLGMALGTGVMAMAIAFVVGTVFLTWLHSRTAKLNSAVLIAAMLVLSAIWGIWGLVLAGPVLAIGRSLTTHLSLDSSSA